MYFFKDKELALRLKEGATSEKEKLYYLLGFIISYGNILPTGILLATEGKYSYEGLLYKVMPLIDIIGITLCYRTNMKGSGINFIERIASLSFPVSVRCVIYYTIVIICSGFALGIYSSIHNTKAEDILYIAHYITSITTILITIYNYYRLNNAMKIAAS